MRWKYLRIKIEKVKGVYCNHVVEYDVHLKIYSTVGYHNHKFDRYKLDFSMAKLNKP